VSVLMFVLLDFQESQRSLLPQACKGFRVVNLSIKLSRGLRFYVGCLGYKVGRFFSHLSFISKSDLFIFSFSLLVVVAKPLERRVIQRGQRISALGLEWSKRYPGQIDLFLIVYRRDALPNGSSIPWRRGWLKAKEPDKPALTPRWIIRSK